MSNWFLLVFIILLLLSIVVSIVLHYKQKEQTRIVEEAMDNLASAMRNSAPDVVEYQSLKRWMGTTINALQEHSQKMDEVFEVHESIEILGDEKDE